MINATPTEHAAEIFFNELIALANDIKDNNMAESYFSEATSGEVKKIQKQLLKLMKDAYAPVANYLSDEGHSWMPNILDE